MTLAKLNTEQRNPKTIDIDTLPTLEALKLFNQEDQSVSQVIFEQLETIAAAIDYLADGFAEGRVFYCGAGTPGRLGFLDAAEVPPTFGVPAGKIVGLIAGGEEALVRTMEGAEDDRQACQQQLEAYNFNEKDALIGIASSGRTPYVLAGLEYANSIGAKTVSISNTKGSAIEAIAKHNIVLVTGPEVITGSTRLKAGTSQKLVLNMISTMLMIRYGKIYSNLMVDVIPSNEKLVDRARRVIVEATGVEYDRAGQLLEEANNSVKHAIVMGLLQVDYQESDQLLAQANNRIADIIHRHNR